MDAALVQALTNATANPGFLTFAVFFGLASYWLFNRGVIIPGAVSDLLVKIAKLEASEKACQQRNADLEKRVQALETQLNHHIKAALQ